MNTNKYSKVETIVEDLFYENNYLKIAFPLLHPKLIWDVEGDFKDMNDYDQAYLKTSFTSAPTAEQAVLSFFHYHLKRDLAIDPKWHGMFNRSLVKSSWLNTYSFHSSKDIIVEYEYPIVKNVYAETFKQLGIKYSCLSNGMNECFFSFDNPTLELGHISYLGQSQTAQMGALCRGTYGGDSFPYYMGCYNLDVELIVDLLS